MKLVGKVAWSGVTLPGLVLWMPLTESAEFEQFCPLAKIRGRKMKKSDKQRIRETALAMDKPFTVQTLKGRLPDLVFTSAAPKGKEWRGILDEMVTKGALSVYKQGASIPLGGSEGDGMQRQYVVSTAATAQAPAETPTVLESVRAAVDAGEYEGLSLKDDAVDRICHGQRNGKVRAEKGDVWDMARHVIAARSGRKLPDILPDVLSVLRKRLPGDSFVVADLAHELRTGVDGRLGRTCEKLYKQGVLDRKRDEGESGRWRYTIKADLWQKSVRQ